MYGSGWQLMESLQFTDHTNNPEREWTNLDRRVDVWIDQSEVLSTHIRIVRSDSIDAEAMMFCRGCVWSLDDEKWIVGGGLG